GAQGYPLLDDGDEDVERDGDPDLGLHGIFGCAEEAFDPQVLLDPFEEQFDLPAAFVERGDGGRRQPELIGEEYQLLSRFGVPEADAPQVFGVMLGGVVAVQRDGLIANDAGRAVCGGGIDPISIHFDLARVTKKAPARCSTWSRAKST